jgi:hypothetical protein
MLTGDHIITTGGVFRTINADTPPVVVTASVTCGSQTPDTAETFLPDVRNHPWIDWA